MKNKLLIKSLIAILTFGMLVCSCVQKETKNSESQNLNVDKENKYYYRSYHCFDFIKQCELEMLKLNNHDTMIYVSSSQFHGYYEEIHGKLTEINDSIYFVKPTKHMALSDFIWSS